jgi:acetylornithine deacetylase/succinyl-diaminopimelate desuccinylase-like protein
MTPAPESVPGSVVAPPDDAVRAAVRAGAEAFLARLTEWLRIPSVSGDPSRAQDVARSAQWLADELEARGFPSAEVWPTSGLPSVFAEWPADDPMAPVVLVYGHHDVQPADSEGLWTTPPFDPVRVDGRLRGRGAADDKGQVLMHLLGLAAHLSASGRTSPGVSLKLLVEGEEESGSTSFGALLRERRDRLVCDAVVVSDTGMWSADVPSLCTGMRGLTGAQVDLHGPDGELHSGSFGGSVANPATELARLLARLHDDDGRVTVPGFYDAVRPPSAQEREMLSRIPFDEGQFLRGARSRAVHGEAGWSTLERLWIRPTAEVNGMWAGYTGPGPKTIVPSSAHAKVTFRLVADQDPAQVAARFRDWVVASVPSGITAEVSWDGPGVRPFHTPLDDSTLLAAQRSLSRAFGKPALFTREGGSGPEAELAEVLDVPLVFLGVGVPEDRIHAPDESVDVELLLKGAEAIAYLWADLAQGR